MYVFPICSILFNSFRGEKFNFFEIGIGSVNPNIPSSMYGAKIPYTSGASLRGWKEYFPCATVYGCDIDRDVLFTEDRIQTFYMDQTDLDQVREEAKKRTYKIVIDDGLHYFPTNWKVFEVLHTCVEKGGFYVIEDIQNFDPKLIVGDFKEFTFTYVELEKFQNSSDNNLLLIRRNL